MGAYKNTTTSFVCLAMGKPKIKKLTQKQSAFIREYMIDRNATQAAIRAGYSAKTSYSIGEENLRKPEIKEVLDKALSDMAEKTETEAEWIRRRLKEEATDFSEFASHSARIRAIELIGKINGIFELDNKQNAATINIRKIELVSLEDDDE